MGAVGAVVAMGAVVAVLVPPRAWAAGRESRDDDDEVTSEMVSVVEELQLAVALACVSPLGLRDADGAGAGEGEGEGARCGAPLSGGAG